MSLESFKGLIKQVGPHADRVLLHCWGEPLLHRELLPMIRLTKHYARAHLSTNVQGFDKELAVELVKAGVDFIMVSMDGATQQVYEKHRRGARCLAPVGRGA